MGIAGFFNYSGDETIAGEAIRSFSGVCTDSDGGIYPETFGTVTRGRLIYEDLCIPEDYSLVEIPSYYDDVPVEIVNEDGSYYFHYEFYCENNQVKNSVTRYPNSTVVSATCTDGIYVEQTTNPDFWNNGRVLNQIEDI